jgi:hypothetical protein
MTRLPNGAKTASFPKHANGVTAATVSNVTTLDKWVYASIGKWHYIQLLAYTNGVWVRSSTAKVYVSY